MTITCKICQAPNCNNPKDLKRRSTLCAMHRMRKSRHKSLELPDRSLPDGIFHVCKIHGELNESQSYKNPKTGHYSCIQCRRLNDKKFEKDNPNKKSQYKNYMYVGKQKFRVSKEEYEKMLKQQNNVCAICQKPETAKNTVPNSKKQTKRLAIDHDHETGKLRQLLCHKCNNVLGMAGDSIEILESAIAYLKKHA